MGRSATPLMIGIAMGALGVILLLRIREVIHEESADEIVDRISGQLQELERLTGASAAT